MEAMDLAVQSDEASPRKIRNEAIARNDAYNAPKRRLRRWLQLAKRPEAIGQDAYFATWAEVIRNYAGQRAAAGTSDAVIRDYLGAQGK